MSEARGFSSSTEEKFEPSQGGLRQGGLLVPFSKRLEMNSKLRRFIPLVAGIQVLVAHAQTDEQMDHFLSLSLEELMEIEVTISTDTRTPLTKAPATVTVLTEEDIKATGATNLVEILESVPGVHVRANQFAFRPLVQFRGASATQTLLMVNGRSTRDLMWTSGIFWKGLPASAIRRIEVIRGPGSALFGADASAGVVNVITHTAGPIEYSEVGGRVGSFDTRAGWVRHGTRWQGYEIGFTAEISDTDGHAPFIEADGQSARDQAAGTAASLAPASAQYGWRNTDVRLSVAKGHWHLLADYVRHSDLGIGLTGAGVLDPVTRASDSRHNIDLLYDNERFARNFGLSASIRYQHLDYTSGNGFFERPPGFDGSWPEGVINQMRSAQRDLLLEASGLYTGFSDHAIRLGAGRAWEDLYRVEQYVNSGTGPDGSPLPPGGPLVDISDTPYAFAPERMRHRDYLFAQDVWNLSSTAELTLGARYDRYSDFGGTFNPRAALVVRNSDKLTTKFMYGQAFRAPSYQELYAETSFSLPNPDLRPERSQTVEVAFSYAATKALYLSLNLFEFHQRDLIRAVPVEGLSKNQFRNSGDHTIRGIEVEGRWQVRKDLRLYANYTVRDHDDDPFQTFDQPDQDGYLRADWGFRHCWNWNLQSNWIGERVRPPGDTWAPADAYWVTDTTLRYSAPGPWEFALSVRNLFDVDARAYTGRSLPDDLPLPERNYYAEVRYSGL